MCARFDIVTFDCYGTLIDWENGIRDAFAPVLGRSGSAATADEALELYTRLEPAVQAGRYLPYREVLDLTAARVLDALGGERVREGTFLSESLPSWLPFEDTNPALSRLRAGGTRLGILSNVDDDLLAATLRHLDVAFDLRITAQAVGSYKPADGHFTAARAAIGDARWIHAAQSNFHDIVPANRHGIPTAWINRKHETALEGGTPGVECNDLRELADHLLG